MSHGHLLPISTPLAIPMAAPALAQTTSAQPTGTSAITASLGGTTTRCTAGSTSYMTGNHQIRAGKLIGSSVHIDQHQVVGSINELLPDQNHDQSSGATS